MSAFYCYTCTECPEIEGRMGGVDRSIKSSWRNAAPERTSQSSSCVAGSLGGISYQIILNRESAPWHSKLEYNNWMRASEASDILILRDNKKQFSFVVSVITAKRFNRILTIFCTMVFECSILVETINEQHCSFSFEMVVISNIKIIIICLERYQSHQTKSGKIM